MSIVTRDHKQASDDYVFVCVNVLAGTIRRFLLDLAPAMLVLDYRGTQSRWFKDRESGLFGSLTRHDSNDHKIRNP